MPVMDDNYYSDDSIDVNGVNQDPSVYDNTGGDYGYTPSTGIDDFLGNQTLPNEADWNITGDDSNIGWGGQALPTVGNQPMWNGMFGNQQPQFSQSGAQDGSIQSVLKDLFTGRKGMANAATGIGGLMSTLSNMQRTKQLNALGNNLMSKADPWGSQRAQYQSMASQFAQNPMTSPVYQQLAKAMQEKVMAQNAATGRRTQIADVEAKMLPQLMQQYNQQLSTLAGLGGSNINPNYGTAAQAMMGGINSGANNFSPLFAAAGKMINPNSLDNMSPQEMMAQALSRSMLGKE